MSDMTVQHNPEQSRYEAHIDGDVAGQLGYERSGASITLTHTEVEPEYEGKGVASQLVREVLDDLRREDLTVRASCSYVNTWVGRHEEYADLVEQV